MQTVAKAAAESPPERPPATLYIVATPIGNLEDITLRAIRTLNEVDLILSEDTRKTGILCAHYQIATQRKSFRIHQLEEDTRHTIALLESGRSVAFVSDAGTPGISDPGSHLVRTLRATLPKIKIVPIPGASAMGAALSVSGWQTNPSLYLGFLSPKGSRRRKKLSEAADFAGVVIVYESVHRFQKLIDDIRITLPQRDILICREMTKIHEQFTLIPARSSDDQYRAIVATVTKKGEFTILVGPDGRSPDESDEDHQEPGED